MEEVVVIERIALSLFVLHNLVVVVVNMRNPCCLEIGIGLDDRRSCCSPFEALQGCRF
jgi:hypothetical protein